MVSAMTCSVRSSRWAVGSSSSTHGRSATTTRASASRARSPAESVDAVLADGRVEAAGQVADAFLERDPAQGRPEQVVVRVGRGEPEVVGDAPGDEHRSLGQPRDLSARQAAPPTGRPPP